MDMYLMNTAAGLRPMYDDDYDKKTRLRLGVVYKATIRPARDLALHRRYFALVNCAWAYLGERATGHFHGDVDCFRKSVEIAAGHCDPVYSLARKEWMEMPRSIAFDRMDDAEFGDLYGRVRDVIFSVFLRDVDEEAFLRDLANF